MAQSKSKPGLDPAELKTTPDVRKHAGPGSFARDYLVRVDDSSGEPGTELVERQYADMRQTALNRGMRPVGDPKLTNVSRPDGRNYLLVYTLAVENVTVADLPPVTRVSKTETS